MLETISIETNRALSDDDYRRLCTLASPERVARADKLPRRRDAANSILGGVAVRDMLSKRTGLPPGELRFTTSPRGKPYLDGKAGGSLTEGGMAGIYFNISHSGGFVACAVNDEDDVGIDIECVKTARNTEAIARRFFRADELAYIAERGGTDAAFFEIWTMKESFVKYCGTGLHMLLASFSVLEEANRGEVGFLRLDVGDGAVCHVCSKPGEAREHRRYTFDGFIETL
jgi:4'-phosphopantetheinyl transferase